MGHLPRLSVHNTSSVEVVNPHPTGSMDDLVIFQHNAYMGDIPVYPGKECQIARHNLLQ